MYNDSVVVNVRNLSELNQLIDHLVVRGYKWNTYDNGVVYERHKENLCLRIDNKLFQIHHDKVLFYQREGHKIIPFHEYMVAWGLAQKPKINLNRVLIQAVSQLQGKVK